MDLLNFIKNNLLIVIICAIILLLCITLIVFIFQRKKRKKILSTDTSHVQKIKKKKTTKIKIDEVFIETLYLGLGGKDNIKEILLDNGRLKFNIINLKLLSKEHLDQISQSGVFITGTFVKLLFKYDAKDIKDALERE